MKIIKELIIPKYKTDIKLDPIFIILGSFLQIINIDRIILITTIFKLLWPPYPIIYKPITMDLLPLELKV